MPLNKEFRAIFLEGKPTQVRKLKRYSNNLPKMGMSGDFGETLLHALDAEFMVNGLVLDTGFRDVYRPLLEIQLY